MIPTQRSVVARLRKRTLDDGWREVSLWRATRIKEFPRNAVMDGKMFSPARHIRWLCILPVNFVEQTSCCSSSYVLWFPSPVKFGIAIVLQCNTSAQSVSYKYSIPIVKREALGFSVLRIWPFLLFGFRTQKLRFFGFGVFCGFFFYHLFYFSVSAKILDSLVIRCGFRFFSLAFKRFLFDNFDLYLYVPQQCARLSPPFPSS